MPKPNSQLTALKNKFTHARKTLSRWFRRIPLLILTGNFLSQAESATDTNLARFDSYLYPANDLGAVYTPQSTTLKVWAPTAKSVAIALFENATTDHFSIFAMTSNADGIWSATLQGDQDGKYYLYEITHADATHRVNDPYARGASANSARTLIYDPSKTNPPGWESDRFVNLKQNVDAILYELHIRDFSIHKSSGVSESARGKYLGLIQPTTLGHLKELGITHAHLLPTFDYANGDETQSADRYTWYNWGYDPVLYNTPEGSYASDPNGTARQKEFKQMVQVLHRENIGVIFDAVFNHTAQTGAGPMSVFDKVVPRSFYRFEKNGRYANGTYCGNEIASEKPMVRKFIVDSVKYWMTEYHIDGFRFDLMGIIDRDTMLEVLREARKINPNAIIYGEGWDMEHILPRDQMMTQRNVHGTGIAAFSDGIRDNIKGSVFNESAPGFVQGATPQHGLDRFLQNIKGQTTSHDIEVSSPNETINYASAHDDHCLWDKLALSAKDAPESLRIQMDKLAAAIVLTSQGVPFLHAGDEFLRSKNGVKNSFNSNDPRVNPIDWSLKTQHKDVFNFYKGLIVLRKSHPAFRIPDKAIVDQHLQFLPNLPAGLVAYTLRDHANGDPWKNILVIYNGSRRPETISVPGNWTIVADAHQAGTQSIRAERDSLPVEPCSLVIAHSE